MKTFSMSNTKFVNLFKKKSILTNLKENNMEKFSICNDFTAF